MDKVKNNFNLLQFLDENETLNNQTPFVGNSGEPHCVDDVQLHPLNLAKLKE